MRVACIDMWSSSHQCPSGLTSMTQSSDPRRVCDIASYRYVLTIIYSVHGLKYSHVYGRILASRKRYPTAYIYGYNNIDQRYVYGVSLTHGQNPRKHIWTFSGAADKLQIISYYTVWSSQEQGCDPSNTRCSVCGNNCPPWHLTSYIADDIEMRLCRPDSLPPLK